METSIIDFIKAHESRECNIIGTRASFIAKPLLRNTKWRARCKTNKVDTYKTISNTQRYDHTLESEKYF